MSNEAIGTVLSQIQEDNEHPVSHLSRTLNRTEKNYSTTEKEYLAVLYALKHFRPYLLGRKLIWMHSRKDPSHRLMRWMFKFTDYKYTFKYKSP